MTATRNEKRVFLFCCESWVMKLAPDSQEPVTIEDRIQFWSDAWTFEHWCQISHSVFSFIAFILVVSTMSNNQSGCGSIDWTSVRVCVYEFVGCFHRSVFFCRWQEEFVQLASWSSRGVLQFTAPHWRGANIYVEILQVLSILREWTCLRDCWTVDCNLGEV